MHSMASCATSMLTAALTLALVPGGFARLIWSFTACATGPSSASSGIHASRRGVGGAGLLAVSAGGAGLLAHAPRPASRIDAASGATRPVRARRSVLADILDDLSGRSPRVLRAFRCLRNAATRPVAQGLAPRRMTAATERGGEIEEAAGGFSGGGSAGGDEGGGGGL